MAKKDTSLWEIETINNRKEHLYRTVHSFIWKHWDNPRERIEQNFFHIEEDNEGLSMDWSRYCPDPKITLIRRFLFWYARNQGTCVDVIIERFCLEPSNSIPRDQYSVEDLEINSETVSKARENIGVYKIQVGELIDFINSSHFPLGIEHDPVKKVDKETKFLNRAHSIIEGLTGANYVKIRTELSDELNLDWCRGLEPNP